MIPLDLMWSDPDDIETWSVSPRGAGWLFGNRVTNEVSLSTSFILVHAWPAYFNSLPGHSQFNHVNSISLIARAHQLVQEGYKYMFAPENNLVTVWSAPNYCYRCGNVASVMEVREGAVVDHDSFKIFEAGMFFNPIVAAVSVSFTPSHSSQPRPKCPQSDGCLCKLSLRSHCFTTSMLNVVFLPELLSLSHLPSQLSVWNGFDISQDLL